MTTWWGFACGPHERDALRAVDTAANAIRMAAEPGLQHTIPLTVYRDANGSCWSISDDPLPPPTHAALAWFAGELSRAQPIRVHRVHRHGSSDAFSLRLSSHVCAIDTGWTPLHTPWEHDHAYSDVPEHPHEESFQLLSGLLGLESALASPQLAVPRVHDDPLVDELAIAALTTGGYERRIVAGRVAVRVQLFGGHVLKVLSEEQFQALEDVWAQMNA